MKTTPLIAAVLTVASAAAITLANPTLSSAATACSNTAQAKASGLLRQMTQNLQESGFTDVKVMPNSFLVQANDKSGNPVKMFITPNSMAEITIHTKSGNPETMFITPKSMAEVPTTGSSNRL
jgi:hypothetical protein